MDAKCNLNPLLRLADICWAIWKARNKSCFEKKQVKHPVEILNHACAFMKFWAGLYKTDTQDQLVEEVNIVLAIAYQVLQNQRQAGVGDPQQQEENGADFVKTLITLYSLLNYSCALSILGLVTYISIINGNGNGGGGGPSGSKKLYSLR